MAQTHFPLSDNSARVVPEVTGRLDSTCHGRVRAPCEIVLPVVRFADDFVVLLVLRGH